MYREEGLTSNTVISKTVISKPGFEWPYNMHPNQPPTP